MTTSHSSELPLQPALRLWPGIVAAVLLWLIRLVVPIVAPNLGLEAVILSVVTGLAILVWWLFFSRAPWSERLGFLILMVAALVATYRVVDISIATGMMGGLLIMYGMSALPTGLVAGAVVGSRLSKIGRASCR